MPDRVTISFPKYTVYEIKFYSDSEEAHFVGTGYKDPEWQFKHRDIFHQCTTEGK